MNSARTEWTRYVIVALSLAFLIIMDAPELRRVLGHPLGLAGIAYSYDGTVTNVDRRAAAAGVHLGDKLDLADASRPQRIGLADSGTADAGERLQIPMLRNGKPYFARITTFRESSDDIRMVWVRDIIAWMLALLATLVLLRRPGPATWGFFFLMLIGLGPVNEVYIVGPPWWRSAAFVAFYLETNVTTYGAVFFALYLLRSGGLPRWRTNIATVTAVVLSIHAVLVIWLAFNTLYGTQSFGTLQVFSALLYLGPLLAAPVILLATYRESTPDVRARLRWVIAGFLLSSVCTIFDEFSSQMPERLAFCRSPT